MEDNIEKEEVEHKTLWDHFVDLFPILLVAAIIIATSIWGDWGCT